MTTNARRQPLLVDRRAHENHLERRRRRRTLSAPSVVRRAAAAHQAAQRDEEKVGLHRSLVHLIDDDVRQRGQLRVALQLAEENPRRAEREPCCRSGAALAADMMANQLPKRAARRAAASRLASTAAVAPAAPPLASGAAMATATERELVTHAACDRDSRDPSRLRAHDAASAAAPGGDSFLQQIRRNLRRLAATRLARDDERVVLFERKKMEHYKRDHI